MKQPLAVDVERIDARIIHALRRLYRPVSRLALFIVFFWFGILKVFDASPANPLVQNLLEKTLPGISFHTFIIFFGCFEMLIGILFLIKGLERIAIPLLAVHMVTTIMPLFLLPAVTWSGFLVPTLEGQYIIKNVVIIALAIGLAAELHPLPHRLLAIKSRT
jgi:uncharacterized membrane protein YkgB